LRIVPQWAGIGLMVGLLSNERRWSPELRWWREQPRRVAGASPTLARGYLCLTVRPRPNLFVIAGILRPLLGSGHRVEPPR
jgi:hypothetical protein